MSNPDLLLCDGCGAKISEKSRARLKTGPDESSVFIADLCSECWAKAAITIGDYGLLPLASALQKWLDMRNRNR